MDEDAGAHSLRLVIETPKPVVVDLGIVLNRAEIGYVLIPMPDFNRGPIRAPGELRGQPRVVGSGAEYEVRTGHARLPRIYDRTALACSATGQQNKSHN